MNDLKSDRLFVILKIILTIIWIIDVCNIGYFGSVLLDTKYECNAVFWLLVFIFIGF